MSQKGKNRDSDSCAHPCGVKVTLKGEKVGR